MWTKKFSQTDTYKVFSPLILTETWSKLRNLRCQKKLSFKILIHDFHEQETGMCSTLALDVANIGINVTIIGVAQQRKSKFSLLWEISQNFATRRQKNKYRFVISHEQNNSFHLNFSSCKHRHRHYIGIIQIFEELQISLDQSSAWFQRQEFVCHSSLLSKGNNKQKSQSFFWIVVI